MLQRCGECKSRQLDCFILKIVTVLFLRKAHQITHGHDPSNSSFMITSQFCSWAQKVTILLAAPSSQALWVGNIL
jgi:hypothetical protein